MATKSQHAEYLQSDHWQQTRKQRIEEGTGACERCEMPRWLAAIAYDQDLHVHHRHYRTKGAEQFDDLEVLCRRCHDIETFGRSDLREPKSARCGQCRSRHWNPYESLCSICLAVSNISEPFFFRLMDDSCTSPNPVWKDVLWEMHFGLRDKGNPTEILMDALIDLDDRYQRLVKTGISDDDISDMEGQ